MGMTLLAENGQEFLQVLSNGALLLGAAGFDLGIDLIGSLLG